MPTSDLTPRPSLGFSASLKWPREGLLRRTRTGAWKLNGKTYRTRALAYAAAQRQGLWVFGGTRFVDPPLAWVGSSPYCEPRGAFAYARRQSITVPADSYTRPGAPVYLRTIGAFTGSFTGSPAEGAVRVEGFRVDSVSHYSEPSGVQHFAQLVEVSKDPEPAS